MLLLESGGPLLLESGSGPVCLEGYTASGGVIVRGRRVCYDNVAPGSAYGSLERTIAGAAAQVVSTPRENVAIGKAAGHERVVCKDSALLSGENIGTQE